jgi:hypothetical protein
MVLISGLPATYVIFFIKFFAISIVYSKIVTIFAIPNNKELRARYKNNVKM